MSSIHLYGYYNENSQFHIYPSPENFLHPLASPGISWLSVVEFFTPSKFGSILLRRTRAQLLMMILAVATCTKEHGS